MQTPPNRLVLAVTCLVLSFGGRHIASAAPSFSAVGDFSLTSNPNGQWSYLYDSGTGPQLQTQTLTNADGGTGVDGWQNGLAQPNRVVTVANTTSSTLSYASIVQPTSLLRMDPQSFTDLTRWTAPSAGTWTISGLFQGIDIGEHSHNVEILENSTTVLLAPATISSFGQQVTFNTTVSLTQGSTIDFVVLTGPTTFTNLSTGLSATIQQTIVPEPASFFLFASGLGLVSIYVKKRAARS